jgi:hypothetical protein
MPEKVKVRFYIREDIEDSWTWDFVELKPGKKMLGFFNHWGSDKDKWDIRQDGRTNVIANIEKIDPKLLKRAQKFFKATIVEKKDKKAKGSSQ